MGRFERSLPLLGEDGLDRLRRAHVLLLGLGGVGAYAAEALARTGIGELTIADSDVYAESNLNRQLGALVDTIGRKKTDVTAERIRAIDPDIAVHRIDRHLTVNDMHFLETVQPDYVIDAIDDIPVKIAVADACSRLGLPLIACLGTGNKWDPAALQVTDLFKTHTDPLAKRMRKALKDLGVISLKVVFSPEEPLRRTHTGRVAPPASLPFVPPAAGIMLAHACVRDLLNHRPHEAIGKTRNEAESTQ